MADSSSRACAQAPRCGARAALERLRWRADSLSSVQRYLHARCLSSWQELCLLNGSANKAERCDVCRAPFSAPPPRLSLHQRAQVALNAAAFHTGRTWAYATLAACAMGTGGGVLASADLLARTAYACLVWLDRRAASSAAFSTLAMLALPVALPMASLASSAVVVFHATAGCVFGFMLSVVGGPLVVAHAAKYGTRSALLALAAAAAAAKRALNAERHK